MTTLSWQQILHVFYLRQDWCYNNTYTRMCTSIRRILCQRIRYLAIELTLCYPYIFQGETYNYKDALILSQFKIDSNQKDKDKVRQLA